MLAFFCLGARYRPWRYSAAVRSRVFGDGASPRRASTLSFVLLAGAFSKSCLRHRFFCGEGGSYLVRGESRRSSMARFRRGAFSGGNPWQVLRSMHPESGLGRENRQFAARFARHASEMSWLWQDMRAMHPKSPANSCLGIHRAKILPGRGAFRCTGPSNHARRADLAIRRGAKPPERSRPRRRRTV